MREKLHFDVNFTYQIGIRQRLHHARGLARLVVLPELIPKHVAFSQDGNNLVILLHLQ